MSNGGLVALLIVIVIIFILTIGVLIYFRRR